MPRMPRISSKEAIRALERLGFDRVRQTGSHVVMKKETEEGEIDCVVPLHRELKVGSTNTMMKMFGLPSRLFLIGKTLRYH
jgi:predicted RNA binding protein YcfA (HicA-like mRNA interferase family)